MAGRETAEPRASAPRWCRLSEALEQGEGRLQHAGEEPIDMSGYGDASDHAEYGYGSYGAGYGPYASNLGISDAAGEARGGLTGPGSSYDAQIGDITSYAHEGYNGGIFQQTTIENGGNYRIATSYSYAAGYTYYGAGAYPVGSVATSPDTCTSYSYLTANDHYGISSYVSFSHSNAAYAGYDHRSSTYFRLESCANGSYHSSYRATSGLFDDSGQAISGTATSYASASSYDSYTGYFSTSHPP